MLFEKATGTGKTLTIAMLMKRWFQAAVISRVLFLADRIELARQAKETFDDYLKEYPSTILYGGKRSLEGQIVVGTLETIASQLGPGGFGHAYFDLVVTDECHRSIYNTHRATLAHFDAIHIGLTATPNPGELRWINEHERQLVRSTYMFFECWDSAAQQGRPTFAYGIRQGIKDGFLADYRIYVAESRLTFEGTTWDDEDVAFIDWGRNAESEDRLKLIIDEYFRVEEERPQPHPRKTIVFAVGERQAAILERLFNRLLPDAACLRIAQQTNRSPAEVRQSFAQKITCYSNNGNPKPIVDRFKFDPLPVVAVSVDMLDTGYDHKEVENLVMLRPTTPELVGHAAIYDGTPPKAICCDLIMKMRVDPAKADVRFVHYCLRSPAVRQFITQRAKGASGTMQKIAKQDVQEIPIPEIPIGEQRRFVNRPDALAVKHLELCRLQAETGAELAAFTPALLAKAFRGEL
jgi:type I restriction enzyme R subunit